MQNIESGVVIYNSADWGKILVSDRDRLRFLHNQSTADFEKRQPGEGCDTVFVTPTARTIDLATGLVLDEEVLLLVSPNRRQYLMDWLDRYIFFADRVRLKDVTDTLASFTLIGAGSERLLAKLEWENLTALTHNSHKLYRLDDVEVRVVGGTELGSIGYRLICDRHQAEKLQQAIVKLGATEIDEHAWEALRITSGRPKPDAELTDDYNPLEAGLWQTISFAKGCYIGQETIARLNTYQGVKQCLWGIELAAPATIGTPMTIAKEKVGVLTSCIESDGKVRGLGYVRSKAGGVGLELMVGDVAAKVVAVPFVSHEYPA